MSLSETLISAYQAKQKTIRTMLRDNQKLRPALKEINTLIEDSTKRGETSCRYALGQLDSDDLEDIQVCLSDSGYVCASDLSGQYLNIVWKTAQPERR